MKKVTILDVAREAGVARSTVSKVMSRSKQFSRDTEERVWQAVSHLGYVPNPHAQSISTGKTRTLGVVILDVVNPHFAAIVKGVSSVASQNGYSVLLADSEEDPVNEEKLIRALQLRTDGVILGGSRLPDETLRRLYSPAQPLVTIGRRPGEGIGSVTTDEYSAGYQLTTHLLARGRQNVAYLAGPNYWVNQERQRGYQDAIRQAGRTPQVIPLASPNLHGGELTVARICTAQPRPDALVVYYDMAALGVMRGLKQLGIRVPEDMALAAFGHLQILDHLSTPLTTADVPSGEMGRAAALLLMDVLAGRSQGEQERVMLAHLQVRESS